MKHLFLYLFCLFLSVELLAQKSNPFNRMLPIMKLPSIDWSSPMNEDEPIIFNGKASLYYQFYNNYEKKTTKDQSAFYANFRTHIRMFQSQSYPVKTPSYQFFLGYQHSFSFDKNNLHFALEIGHYSNGQSNCAWDESIKDGTQDCNSNYRAIDDRDNLAQLLNRSSGNFSTNLSQISIEYVLPPISKSILKRRAIAHRFGFSFRHNHNAFAYLIDFGTGERELQFIGDQVYRIMAETFFAPLQTMDFSIKNELEYVNNVHPSINPWRYRLSLNIFPYDWRTAFFIAYTSGHDEYNYRIVDSRNQVTLGVRWDLLDRKEFKDHLYE